MGCNKSRIGINSKKGAGGLTDIAEPDKEEVDVPEIPDNEFYPPPKQNLLKKRDIYVPQKYKDVHKHARKIPPKTDTSFDTLVNYLAVPFRDDLKKVRALFMWMCVQPITTSKYRNLDKLSGEELAETPRGFMKLIKEGRASYASLLAVLCRKAGIKCVIIKGICKGSGYEVGTIDNISELRTKWNAVYVRDSWRVIHPLWACQSVVGRAGMDNWTTTDDDDEKEGCIIQRINEFFFLTDPQDFLYFCLPDEPKWQLLTFPYDLQRFVEIPFLQEAYFGLGLRLLSKQSCILEDNKGIVEISFRVPHDYPTQMNYDLLFKRDESESELDDESQLNKYVIMSFEDNIWNFIVRFPVPGVYKLTVFGGHVERKNLPWIADFRLICKYPHNNFLPLPDAPWIGYGYSNQAEQIGLIKPSHRSGIILIKPHQSIHITFMLENFLKVKVQYLNVDLTASELSRSFKCIKCVIRLDIIGTVPQHGVYIIKIYGKAKESTSDFNNICNYLLCTKDPRNSDREHPGWENGLEKILRKNLKQAIATRDFENLKLATEKFTNAGLEDKGDYTQANHVLQLLEMQQELVNAIKRRNSGLLEKAISNARCSEYQERLQVLVLQAEDLLSELHALNGFPHPIPDLNKSVIAELTNYKNPPILVHEVMIATFLLLGESEKEIQNWEYIQSLMKMIGKRSMLRRFKEFDLNFVDEEIKMKSRNICEKFTENQVRKTSSGAASFYVWISSVLQPSENSFDISENTVTDILE